MSALTSAWPAAGSSRQRTAARRVFLDTAIAAAYLKYREIIFRGNGAGGLVLTM